jgi:hypothetical protein
VPALVGLGEGKVVVGQVVDGDPVGLVGLRARVEELAPLGAERPKARLRIQRD